MRNWLGLLLGTCALLGLLVACGESTGSEEKPAKNCTSDEQCYRADSNWRCSSVLGTCYTRGLCTSDKWCADFYYNGDFPYCDDGVCVSDLGQDGDQTTEVECTSDAQCTNPSSNWRCNPSAGVCIDRGTCTDDTWCVGAYGEGARPYCKDGLCLSDPNVDGDQIVDPTDGDQIIDPTDGDQIIDPVDGDPAEHVEYDYDRPDVEFDIDTALVACDADASLKTPTIRVEPASLDFGAVPMGSVIMRTTRICNVSGVELDLSSIRFSRDVSAEFQKDHAQVPVKLAAGKGIDVFVIYSPSDNVQDKGNLEILSNDTAHQYIAVPLLATMKAAPFLQITPEVLQFAGAPTGQVVTKVLTIKNIGNAPTSIHQLQISSNYTAGANPFSIVEVTRDAVAAGDAPWNLQPGKTLTVVIGLKSPGVAVEGLLEIPWIDGYSAEVASSVQLTTGSVPSCATPDAGANQTVEPLAIVQLDGSKSKDLNGTIQGYRWDFLTKPANAARAIIVASNCSNPAGGGCASIEGQYTNESKPKFYAELAGDYGVQLMVKDSETACNGSGIKKDNVKITAVPPSTIHVQLMWSMSSDQDLHIVRPGGAHSRDTATEDDCHYSNCTTRCAQYPAHPERCPCMSRGCPYGPNNAPDWGVKGQRYDDPTLDVDDTSGTGPENVNLSAPDPGEYLISVENYSGGPTGNVSTVRIWVFGQLVSTLQYPPAGSGLDYFATNNHWNVAKIKVTDPTTIEVIPITTPADLVSPSN